MGEVEKALVAGICMNSCHQSGFQSKIFKNNLGYRCETVGRTGSIRNDVMLLRVIFAGVDTHDDGNIRILGRCGYDHFTRSCGEVFGSIFPVSEQTGAFSSYIHAQLLPLQLFRILYGSKCDGSAIDFNGVIFRMYIKIQFAVYGIISKQMRHGSRIC